MRAFVLAFGLVSAICSNAAAMEDGQIFHMVRGEVDASDLDGDALLTWDGETWFGGDYNKLWLKSEGDIVGGETETGEFQALYSRNVAPFWDVQAGVRVDWAPETTTYLALGVQGLSPYQFETEVTAFLSDAGDASVRLHQRIDLLFTQRLVLEPHIELNAYAQDVEELGVGAGLSDVEAGLQLRYEVTRKFAPYVDLVIERALGETAQRARAEGEDVEETTLRAGLRFWF